MGAARDAEGYTPKQRLFIQYYLGNGLNGVEAAREAGYQGSYNVLGVVASRNLSNPKIRIKIDEELNARLMSAQEVLTRLANMASADVGDFINEEGQIDFGRARERHKTGLIKKLKVTERIVHGEMQVTTELELHDPLRALDQLGRYYALFTDRIQVDVVAVEILARIGRTPAQAFQEMVDRVAAKTGGKPALIEGGE